MVLYEGTKLEQLTQVPLRVACTFLFPCRQLRVAFQGALLLLLASFCAEGCTFWSSHPSRGWLASRKPSE